MRLLKNLIRRRSSPEKEMGDSIYTQLARSLERVTPRARSFALDTMRDIMRAVERREVDHSDAWWAEKSGRGRNSGPALVAFQKLPVVKDFLVSQGIRLETRLDSPQYKIKAAENPPAGSYGEMLLNAENAYDLRIKQRRQQDLDIASELSRPHL